MNSDNGDINLTVDVDITEMLGSEKIVYFNIGDSKCCSKLSSDTVISKTLKVSFKYSHMYKFNIATGERIY